MTESYRGSCLCGAVRYQATGPLTNVVACHCTQCRKQSGHFYAATNVADERLSVDGVDNLTWYQSSAEARRGFCRSCGSALFWKHQDDDSTSVLVGSLDGPTGLRFDRHIYCEDKGDYYDIPADEEQLPSA